MLKREEIRDAEDAEGRRDVWPAIHRTFSIKSNDILYTEGF